MFSILLSLLLGHSVYLPIHWAAAYPAFDGRLILRRIALAEAPEEPRLRISQAVLSLDFASLAGQQTELRSVMLFNVRAEADLDRPLQFAVRWRGKAKSRLLQGEAGFSAAGGRPEAAAGYKLHIASAAASGGTLVLHRGTRSVKLRLVEMRASELTFPLIQPEVRIHARTLVVEHDGKPVAAPVPAILDLAWHPQDDRLVLDLTTKSLPLDVLSALFPETKGGSGKIFGRLHSGTAQTGGTLSGKLSLEYGGGSWQLR